MTADVGSRPDRPADDRTQSDRTSSNPWTRVLGILVLGSFAAATKTTRGPRRGTGHRPVAERIEEAAA